jgi:hypothetical protein
MTGQSGPLRNGTYPFLVLGQSVPTQAIAPPLALSASRWRYN